MNKLRWAAGSRKTVFLEAIVTKLAAALDASEKRAVLGVVSPLSLEVSTLRQGYRGNIQVSVLVETGRESGIWTSLLVPALWC